MLPSQKSSRPYTFIRAYLIVKVKVEAMNPYAPSPCPALSTTLSSLNNLISLSNHTLPISPHPGTLNPNLIQCPFNPNHLIPPPSLFLHHLRCPSSPNPIPDPNQLLHSLTYPKTLTNTNNSESHGPNSPLSFSLDFASNFFYRDCHGVVSFSDLQNINTTFTLPPFLSPNNFSDSEIQNSNSETLSAPILPSQYLAITRELESWNDFPTTYSDNVRSAISGIGIAKERDLTNWIIVNSPRYGLVIDTAMQQHIFLLCCLCFKSILREAFVSMDKRNFQLDCPILNPALTWLASQLSILYGTMNGKFFVLNFVKNCISVGASSLLLFRSQNSDSNSGDIKDAKLDAQAEEKTNWLLNRKVFVSQVEAAVAALYERSLLERKIKGLWFPQKPTNYQLVAEQCYLSEKANEERKKRPGFRPLIDHDGLLRQRSSNQESREKTLEELLAEERDYKRRRMSYRGKRIKPSTLQVMRDVIEEFMEEIKQAGSVESPVNVSKESGLLPCKPSSRHDMEADYSRNVNHDSPAVTNNNPSYHEQQSRTNYCDKSKAVEDVISRDYEQRKRKHYRSHDYAEDQWNTGRQKYHRDHASTSPERRKSHSRPHEHSVHHKRQDYSNRKKYDHLSGTRDRRQKDSDRNHVPDSFLNNAFSDRYVPSESLDICDDDISSNAKYIKSDKFYDKEHH